MLFSPGKKWSLRNGSITKMPHNPRMTLGMAASISMRKISGWRTQFGANSVRNTAVATAKGVAMMSASTEVTSVPKMKGNAAYSFSTGFQTEFVRNPNPNLVNVGPVPLKSCQPTRITRATTAKAITRQRVRNPCSAKGDTGRMRRVAGAAASGVVSGLATRTDIRAKIRWQTLFPKGRRRGPSRRRGRREFPASG